MVRTFLALTIMLILPFKCSGVDRDAPAALDHFVFLCMDIGNVDNVTEEVFVMNDGGYKGTLQTLIVKTSTSNVQIPPTVSNSKRVRNKEECIQGSNYTSKAVSIIQSTNPLEKPIVGIVSFESSGYGESHSLIKVDQLGKEYYAVTYCEVYGKCQLAVAALTDGTKVTITLPSSNDDFMLEYNGNTYRKGQHITNHMQRFDAIQLQSDFDLTGTKIKSSKNVAVFSGSREAVVGVKGQQSFLIEQLLPTEKWKTEYAYSCSYCEGQGSFIRVTAHTAGTTIHISGYSPLQINSDNGWIHKRIEKNAAVYIKSNNPIQVVAFVMNRKKGSGMCASAMHLVPAVDDFTNTYAMHYASISETLELTIIGSSKNTEPYEYNNSPVTGTTTYFPNSNLHSITFNVSSTNTRHRIVNKHNFGMYAVTTTTKKTTHAFMPFSSVTPSEIPTPPVYAGDGVDSDNNDGKDNVNCDSKHNPRSRERKDCKMYTSNVEDTKGYDFQIVFPSFDDEEKEYLINVAGKEVTCFYNRECDGDAIFATPIGNSHDIEAVRCALNETGYYKARVVNLFTYQSSAKEASVLVSIIGASTFGTYLALPTDVLGLEYYAVTYCKDEYRCGCALSAIHSNTIVNIELPDRQLNVSWGSSTFEQNNVMQVNFSDHRDAFFFTSQSDLTGTYIKANAPISVVCGGGTKTSMFIEQMYPIQKAGSSYTVIKMNMLYRAIATAANTIVTATGSIIIKKLLRKAGDFEDFHFEKYSEIKSSKPVFIVAINVDNMKGDMFNVVPDFARETEYVVTIPRKLSGRSLVLISSSGQRIHVQKINGDMETLKITEENYIHPLDKDISYLHLEGGQHFAAYIFGDSNDTSTKFFSTSLGRKMQNVATGLCTIQPMTVGDKIDNDCDGLTDEEICVKGTYEYDKENYLQHGKYIVDYDIDGMLDEDCFTQLSVSSSIFESSSLEISSDFVLDSTDQSVMVPSSILETSNLGITTDLMLDSTTDFYESPVYTASTETTADWTASESHNVEDTMTPFLTSFSDALNTNLVDGYNSQTLNEFQTIAPTTSWDFSASLSSTVSVRSCKCPCSRTPDPQLLNLTMEQLITVMKETRKELIVNKSDLTAFKLKKISVRDNRPSAITVGVLGGFMIAFVVGTIVTVDLLSIRKYLEMAKGFGSAFSK